MKVSWRSSEFWLLVATAIVLLGDAVLGVFSGSSVFAEYPEAREFIEKSALAWAGFRTFLKAVTAVFASKQAPVVG